MLSVITVNWNVRDLLLECVDSVTKSAGEMAFEHVVVDNASSDGSADAVAELRPEVKLIRNGENAGFARANNQGTRVARGRYLLFLNPDTTVVGDALQVMVRLMEERDDLGVLGARLVDAELRMSRDNGYRFPTLRTVVNEYLQIARAARSPRLFPGILRSTDFEGIDECDWVSGAALMMPRELALAEPWNEEIFFFAEDVELCDRVRRRGLRVACTAEANVVHESGQSMKKQSEDFLAGKASGTAMLLRKRQGAVAAWLAEQTIQASLGGRAFLHGLRYRLSGDPGSLEKSRRLRQYLQMERR